MNVQRVLVPNDGNKNQLAKILHIDYKRLLVRVKKYGLANKKEDPMRRLVPLSFVIIGALLIPAAVFPGDNPVKTGSTVKAVKEMSEKDQTALALSAAPAHIARESGVMIYGTDGKLTEVKKSSNGFTCIPTVMNLPIPDPMCMDAASHQWMNDMMSGAPKPTNSVPGVAYMARGGSHYEKDGKVVLGGEGAKVVKEPPHWMIFWPFDPMTTKLPTVPNPSGVYIMFEDSPYAHLMIYQDPNKMK